MYALRPVRFCLSIAVLLAALCLSGGGALAQSSEESVVAFLGHLNCRATTSPGGSDNLNAVYGVLVGYTNGTFRTWGGYLHYKRSAAAGFQHGPLIERPLFVHSFFRTRQPTTIDTVIDERQVRFVRVAVGLIEDDDPFGLAAGNSGRQDVTAQLQAISWGRHAAELLASQPDSIFGRQVLQAGHTSYDEDIGRHEVMLTASDLAAARNATSVTSLSHLASFRVPPSGTARRGFQMRGDGSNYHGSLWLTRGPRAIFSSAIAANSTLVPVPSTRISFLLHNDTPFDVKIQVRLEGGRSFSVPLAAGQRKQYTPGNRPGEVPVVTVSLPEGPLAGGPELARFRGALRRVGPLNVTDGFQYVLTFHGTSVEWVRR